MKLVLLIFLEHGHIIMTRVITADGFCLRIIFLYSSVIRNMTFFKIYIYIFFTDENGNFVNRGIGDGLGS